MLDKLDHTAVHTKDTQSALTPAMAVELLKMGNQRFSQFKMLGRNFPEQVKDTSTGQYPFASILSCIDSRVPAEIIFDLGIGDIFSARVAGNFINKDILGSLEFACKIAGSKAIVVMGHTHCGAVKGACDHVEMGNLTAMLRNIEPAVEGITDEPGERNSKNTGFVQKVSELNVQLNVAGIRERSPILREMEENGEIVILGAMYDIETGEVTFYEEV